MARQILSLDGAWDFHFAGDARSALEHVEQWRKCIVPAPWQAQFPDLRQRNGRAWYRRTFELPPDWPSGAVFLRFGAVNHHARLLVNHTPVAEHEGGWLPFEVEIGAVLRPGANEVAVHVTAPTDNPAVYPQYPFSETLVGKQSWYGPQGGIWQSVLLERRAPDHIRLRPRRADGALEVRLDLSRRLSRPHDLELRIDGPDGRTVGAADLTLAEGQSQASATLLHGGADLVSDVTLRWRCGTAIGQTGPLVLEQGVRDLPTATFPAPAVERAAIQRLELNLMADGRVLATNHLELTILPERVRPAREQIWPVDELADRIQSLGYRLAPSLLEADAAIAAALDDALCAAIRGGARVVLLANAPMELQPIFPHWQAARVVRRSGTMWQGDWISSFSWLRRDGPFARIPGGPLIDHAFDRVIPNHVVAGCST